MAMIEKTQADPAATVERSPLGDYTISRVIKGGWQLAGGHGAIDRETALEGMRCYVQAGITTFDCADIYTGVEELIGAFLRHQNRSMDSGDMPYVQVHTKYVPDLTTLSTLGRQEVEASIDRSLGRLGVERLDMVQFHWWDYDVKGYVETALHLEAQRSAGKIRHIGVTNFDVPRLQELLDAGVPVVANQVQYSLLDHRPENGMVDFCRREGIALLCYGTLAGGFLSARYSGASEPQSPLENRSLTKYKLIIGEFGGWPIFQELHACLARIAAKHETTVAAVAGRYVLQKPGVTAIIVGARHARHLDATLGLFRFKLDGDDLEALGAITGRAQGPQGDTYTLERVKGGEHAAIIKYDLNRT